MSFGISFPKKTRAALPASTATYLAVFGLLLCALLLRLVGLDRYVTPDEPVWVHRAIQFRDALIARNWAKVPVTGHPGVTTMWLGAAGISARQLLTPAESAQHLDWIRPMTWLAPGNGAAYRHLWYFLPSGRIAVALVTTAGLGLSYLMAGRLLGSRLAILALGLLAFDPFLAGHSGLLHTDGLLATFSMLALLAAACALRARAPLGWWAVAGLFAGLTVLTKSPGILVALAVLAGAGLGSLVFALPPRQADLAAGVQGTRLTLGERLARSAAHLVVALAAIALTVGVLYPALWADPTGVARTLIGFAGRHTEDTLRPIYFLGRMTFDPGSAFYPLTLLLRASPLVLAGLVIGILRMRRLPVEQRRLFLGLLAFAVAYGAMMTIGAKKHDRYLLPALPPLTVAAAMSVGDWAKRHAGKVVLLQILITAPFLPYPLTAFSPLAGGPWGAARVMSVDWGEGMGAAARWLNRQPDAEHLTVAAASVPSFAPLFVGRTVPLEQAALADYVVDSSHQETPGLQQTHRVQLAWLDHAAIYTNIAPLEQAAYLAERTEVADTILVDADIPFARHYHGLATIVSAADLVTSANVADFIAGLAPSARLWYVSSPAAAPVTTALVLDALEATGSEVSRATVGSAVITQFELDAPTSAPRTDSVATFGGQLKLVAAVLPAAPIEAVFPVYLRWQTVVAGPEDLYVTLRLQDQGGHVLSEVGQPVMNETIFPTNAWSPGDWADATVQMALPPRTLPGTATLVAMISEAAGVGAQLGAWGTDGEFLGVQVVLGEVQVSPPSAPTGEPDCADSQTHQAGPLRACVDDVKPATVWSGDRLAVPVTWTAQQTLLEDMSIRWQLLDATGAPAQEQTTTLAAHPTSRWRTHDSYTVPYDLRVDPSLPATEYTLALNVLASDGEPLWAIDQVVKKIQVLPRERSFELPTRIAHPLDLTLGGVVHLRGFDLAVPDGSLQTLQPGDAISITLIWQGDGPTDLDYTVFAHLIGPDGNPYGQVDRFPADGAAPTSTWAPGQVVVDHLLLEVAAGAPQGAYQVVVGMYDALRGGRPPMVDGAGQRLSNDQLALPTALAVSGGQP